METTMHSLEEIITPISRLCTLYYDIAMIWTHKTYEFVLTLH